MPMLMPVLFRFFLLVRQHLVCNFDLDLLALFSEVSHWEKFQVRVSMVPGL